MLFIDRRARGARYFGDQEMENQRRQFLRLVASVAALPTLSRTAWPQTYPSRVVRIFAGFAAGGGTDIAARIIAEWLSVRLRGQFVVENRPGAGGNIATEAVAKASPDGHSLLVAGTSNTVNTTLLKLNHNFARDFTAIATVMISPNSLVVHPSVPARSVREFIDYAKANPGKINMGSPGIGTGPHMAGELFKFMAGVNILHVPYRGGTAAMPDFLAGNIQMMFAVPNQVMEHLKVGALRALAVTTAARWKELPELPTINEFLPGYESSNWFGVVGPANIPAEIVEQLNREINACLADPKVVDRIAGLGNQVLKTSPAEFGKLIADETEKWAKLIHAANIKAG